MEGAGVYQLSLNVICLWHELIMNCNFVSASMTLNNELKPDNNAKSRLK